MNLDSDHQTTLGDEPTIGRGDLNEPITTRIWIRTIAPGLAYHNPSAAISIDKTPSKLLETPVKLNGELVGMGLTALASFAMPFFHTIVTQSRPSNPN